MTIAKIIWVDDEIESLFEQSEEEIESQMKSISRAFSPEIPQEKKYEFRPSP